MKASRLLVLLFLLVAVVAPSRVTGYTISPFLPESTRQRRLTYLQVSESDDEFEHDDFDAHKVARDNEMTQFLKEFQKVQSDETFQLRNASCTSGVVAVLPDWVRRIAVDYPNFVAGSASDVLYVGNLESGEILASTATLQPTKENATVSQERVDHVVNQLYGHFDGGGTIGVACSGSLICEARRSGGVQVWRFLENKQLLYQGAFLTTELITSIYIATDCLFVGTDRGHVLLYELDEERPPLTLRTCADRNWTVPGLVTDLQVHLEHIVVSTDSGVVELISLDTDTQKSFSPPFDGNERRSYNVFPTCATLLDIEGTFVIAAGSNDGSIFLMDVETSKSRQLMPRHFAAVKCLGTPGTNLLITAGLDGTLRMWDVKERMFLYQFVGYKVWLGSLYTDGRRIITDGADNTLIMHDFTKSSSKKD